MFLSTLYLINVSDPEMVAVIDVFPCCSKLSEFMYLLAGIYLVAVQIVANPPNFGCYCLTRNDHLIAIDF
jgi:hypothetical protein